MDTHSTSTSRLRILLILTDLIGLASAYSLAYALRLSGFDPHLLTSGLALIFAALNFLSLYLFDLYEFDPQVPRSRKALQTLGAVFIAGCVIVLFAFLTGAVEFSGLIGRGVLIGAQTLFALWAALVRLGLAYWFRASSARARFLVLGTDDNIKAFAKDLSASGFPGTFSLLTQGVPPGTPSIASVAAHTPQRLQIEGSWQDFERLAAQDWSAIIVCAGNNLPEELVEVLMTIRLRGVRVVDLTDFYEDLWSKVPVFYLQRSWFAMAQGFRLLHNPVGLRLKRLFDLLGAIFLLVITSPLLALFSIAVKIESRGPALFRQVRVGESGKTFMVYKLRSMRQDAEKEGAQWAKVKDSRVTKVGSFIRATRIDELPQLVNVLRGEMSFIGPRPERPEFMDRLEAEIPFYNLRHILKPGVTGWAQVMYPYGASVEDAKEKLQYELYYIKNYSLLLDATIVLKTVRVVLFGRGR